MTKEWVVTDPEDVLRMAQAAQSLIKAATQLRSMDPEGDKVSSAILVAAARKLALWIDGSVTEEEVGD